MWRTKKERVSKELTPKGLPLIEIKVNYLAFSFN